MRLINTETMKMEEFFNENVPPYAILSHRWGAEEVSLQEWNRIQAIETKMESVRNHAAFQAPRHHNDYYHESLQDQYKEFEIEKSTLLQKAGFAKIISFIEATKVEGESQSPRSEDERAQQVRYVWADTCCIDKTNNAELSEAINSMFRWYQEAEICYVYLADVPTGLTESELEEHICASKWFERGWTFQELLAPHVVMFYDQRWDFLFEKRDRCSLLSRITRIHDTFLSESRRIGEACTAMKMSWAATRTTTRDEDLAYCLLGIFDVSMPPLYGEGKKAFVRLQEEILRHSGDLSIFAWGFNALIDWQGQGLFVNSPTDFIGCSNLVSTLNYGRVAYTIILLTNITLSVLMWCKRLRSRDPSFIYVCLNYYNDKDDKRSQLLFPLVFSRQYDGRGYPSALKKLRSRSDIDALHFDRLTGTRPILDRQGLFSKNKGDKSSFIDGDYTISILKRESVLWIPDSIFEVSFKGLDVSSSQIVLKEVYPPHSLGRSRKGCPPSLQFGHDNRTWYPGCEPIETLHTFDNRYHKVAYVKLSHRVHQKSKVVITISCNDFQNMTDINDYIEVRLSAWPAKPKYKSLAAFEIRRDYVVGY